MLLFMSKKKKSLSFLVVLSGFFFSLFPVAVMSLQNIVVVGGGVQGTSVAYHLADRLSSDGKGSKRKNGGDVTITLLESQKPASAASGKGGGFMARSWGDGTATQGLHHLAFDMYAKLAPELGCSSYRKLPVLSVAPGQNDAGIKKARKDTNGLASILPPWLDGNTGRISPMGWGDDTAQITPKEFVDAMLKRMGPDKIKVVLGTCTGVETATATDDNEKKIVTAVQYQPQSDDDDDDEGTMMTKSIPADVVVVSAGPWSCAAEDWFEGSGLQLPMEGVKSTSIVWKPQLSSSSSSNTEQQATALFCGEDNRYGTHLEVYPRPDGTIYLCGIGGSDYIAKDDLKAGAFRRTCEAKESRVEAAVASFRQMSASYASAQLDRTQACMRPCPPDAMPYMGAIPGYEGAYINAGHNCWGIAWAPACGKAMAELILDGKSSCVDLSPFNPARFTPTKTRRGGRGRKQQGTSVGEQW